MEAATGSRRQYLGPGRHDGDLGLGTNPTGHNIRPDVNGGEPTGFEDLRSAPSTYQYTFNTVGTFDYYCSAHGGPNGVGMSGIVTVVSQQP